MVTDDDDTLRAPRPGEAPLPDAPIQPGTRVGDYVVQGFLGAGAHGGVFLAEHRVLGRRAALKVLRGDPSRTGELTARFVREARAVNRIRHAGIVDIYDIGALPDGRPYCVMELLPGRTLKALLLERGALPPEEAVALVAPVCEALQAAHQAGVVHRDVKASNVMVLKEGPAPEVKLLDFGVAKLEEPGAAGLTAVGQRIGSPVSMSPEQIRGEPVDLRADVYALGVLLHQLLTGRAPFESEDPAEIERMHLEAEPPRPGALARVPPALDAVVARALEKLPARRWPSALALLEAARSALGAVPATAPRGVPAVAVHVSVRAAGAAGAEGLLALADACDFAEAFLAGAGFTLTLATSGTLLGVRLLAPEPEAARASRAAAVELARTLAARLPRPGLQVTVCVHAADALVRDSSGGPEVTGGPVCETASWVPGAGTGFHATPQATAGLAG